MLSDFATETILPLPPLNNVLIGEFLSRGGPNPNEYSALDQWFDGIYRHSTSPEQRRLLSDHLRKAFGRAMSEETLQGFVYVKPHGYAGDFEIIDRIYSRHISSDPGLRRWDLYFQQHSAALAVRNRKRYFLELTQSHVERSSRPALRVLICGSGPGRDVFEFFSRWPETRVTFDCIDIDSKAISFATDLNSEWANRVSFKKCNVLRFSPDANSYDLIWAAGLFDYFDDRLFKRVMIDLYSGLAERGELVIGNFSTENPSRAYMEFGEWFLHHRSPGHLEVLACSTGLPPTRVCVRHEPQRVNLFLHVQNG
jgi:SAM-dependent methyltransferase